ncbi:hypothetical protein EBQ74_07565 [bacterium]|nr:hypothetical protein [bacterium]
MKRSLFKIFLGLGLLYFVLNLLFSSSWVQDFILTEVRKLAEPQGVQINIAQVEVSLPIPKIYLNKVTLRTSPQSPIQLPSALSMERIKIVINPLSILLGKLTLSEVSLFQPKIVLEEADLLYRKIEKVLKAQSKWKVKSGGLNIEIEKVGIVDAYVLVSLSDPKIAIDSGRFTLFVAKAARDQFNITSNFSSLTLDRGKLHSVIRSADFDLDVTSTSVRANRVNIESDWMSLTLKGATSLPIRANTGPDSFRAVYSIKASVAALTQIEEFQKNLPKDFSGTVLSEGTLEKNGKSYSGQGKLAIHDFNWDGYLLNSGQLAFTADGKKMTAFGLSIDVGQGKITSEKMILEFKEKSPIYGEFQIDNLELHRLMDNLKIKRNPLYVGLNGKGKFKGSLDEPFNLSGELNTDFNHLTVLAHPDEPISVDNTVVTIDGGKLTSSFELKKGEGHIKSQVQVLDGAIVADSHWKTGLSPEVVVEGKSLSLSRLKKIQDLAFGGMADLQAKIKIENGEPVISGAFDLKNGEIARVVLGSVKGKVQYQDDLLSFESLELPSLDTIRSDGFVDFKPKLTRYKFNISTKRASVDQVFDFFKRNKLEFSPPRGGELSAKVTLEGGHDEKGIQVTANGNVRGISWFEEKWLGGAFSLTYRDDFVEITRGTLTKPRGAIGFQGFFKKQKSKLRLQSYGLKLEDLDYVKGAPIAGEIVGQINLEGDLTRPNGRGELKLIKTLFRNQSLGDSNISIKETPEKTEFVGNLFGQSLQGRLVSIHSEKQLGSEILLNFKNCNVLPLISMWSGKDLAAFGGIRATGDVELSGNFNEWHSVSGSGTLGELELELKTAPVKNQRPISFVVEKGSIKVSPFELSGQDSLISGNIDINPKQAVQGALDAKVDLLYLQPFIPGLEFGSGKVTAGIRVSGKLPNFEMLGNLSVDDGAFKIKNLSEDFRNVRSQFSLTQDSLRIDRFEATHGGGNLQVKGGIEIGRFSKFAPNLQLVARGIGFKQDRYLSLKLSGDLQLKGSEFPLLLSGNCKIDEGRLSEFDIKPQGGSDEVSLKFDLKCRAERGFYVDTEVMQAEWKGDFHLLGDNTALGLLGEADSIKGAVFFKETQFNLSSANVKFESREKISPRFNVLAKSFVKEQRTQVPIEYEVNLSAYGTPQDYKIRLSSVPSLAEPDLIALLILGVTTRGQDDNYLDFGSTLVGKSPLQSKLQNELGVNIRVNMQRTGIGGAGTPGSSQGATQGFPLVNNDGSVPAVKIQKEITNKTKVSYSSTLDQNAMKEFKIEQLLDDNFTVNASAVDKIRGTTQNDAIKSYGLDFRYRFQFE